MAEITLEEQHGLLYEYEKGFHAIYLMNAGIELGLFQILNNHEDGLDYGELADQLGLHKPYVRTWCYTAYHLGLIDCDQDGRFNLAPHMNTLLIDKNSPFHFGARPKMMVSWMADALKRFTEDFKSGSSYFYNHFEGEQGCQFSRDAKALSNHLVPVAFMYAVIPRITGLKDKLSEGARVLDVGCGSGLLVIRLAQSYPNSKFVGIELDRFAVEDAQRDIKDNGIEDRVSVLLLSAADMDYESEFDLITMGFVLHEISPELKKISISNCYKALKDSGEIAILDFAYPEMMGDFRNPKYSLGIMDQFFEITWNSQQLSSSAKHQLLLELGFKNPYTIPLADGSIEATYATK